LRTKLSAVSGSRTGARGAGLGDSGFAARITGPGTGGGGADGGGGGGSTKLDVMGSERASGGASGIGAEGSYTRPPESICAADRRLSSFVRSRIGRRTTHQPTWVAPQRNAWNGTVEKRVGTMPFWR